MYSEPGGTLGPESRTWTRSRRVRRVFWLVGAMTASAALAASLPAAASTGTATINAGSLAFVSTPPNVIFVDILNGTDQTPTATETLDVGDATGSGTGWNITATSTTFTTGLHSLSTSATTVGAAPAEACDASTTCTLATNAITFPYTLPAAVIAPTATKLYNSAASTGMGNQTVTATWRLSIPANTFAGTYTSTRIVSLVSAP